MKNQYFGDINDYRKYGLLRCLAETSFDVGVCWMLTLPDGRTDGNKIDYLDAPSRWRHHDPGLFDFLKRCVATGQRDVRRFEKSGLLPNARFFSDVLLDDRVRRATYWAAALRSLDAADLLFLDPDTGLEVSSVPYGRKESCRYLYWREVELAAKSGKSMVIFQHWKRENRNDLIARLSKDLRRHFPADASITAIRSAFVLFLVVAQAEHRVRLESARGLLVERWNGELEIT